MPFCEAGSFGCSEARPAMFGLLVCLLAVEVDFVLEYQCHMLWLQIDHQSWKPLFSISLVIVFSESLRRDSCSSIASDARVLP